MGFLGYLSNHVILSIIEVHKRCFLKTSAIFLCSARLFQPVFTRKQLVARIFRKSNSIFLVLVLSQNTDINFWKISQRKII